jgi:hypothetical protein
MHLGRLVSKLSHNYPVLQVMGFGQIDQKNKASVEPDELNLFDNRKRTSIRKETVSINTETASIGNKLKKFIWNEKDV